MKMLRNIAEIPFRIIKAKFLQKI